MRLIVQNIGKIDYADIEINGITVIAGPNNTGKSTVGKTLYSVFSGFHKYNEKIFEHREKSIRNLVFRFLNENRIYIYRSINVLMVLSDSILNAIMNKTFNEGFLKKEIEKIINNSDLKDFIKTYEEINEESIKKLYSSILERVEINDMDILKDILRAEFSEEFSNQINNIYKQDEGKVLLKIRSNKIEVFINQNNITNVINPMVLYIDPVYIDSPDIIDDIGYDANFDSLFTALNPNIKNHRENLRLRLRVASEVNIVESLLSDKKLNSIYKKIMSAAPGSLIATKNKDGYSYKEGIDSPSMKIKNLSMGLKTFLIIKKLMENNSLEEGGLIILDEPEIHLHPSWQLIFAEIIVLLQKEFKMHILLATHSPYFARAIEVYSVKYGLFDKCKFYRSYEKYNSFKFDDVTSNTEIIYSELGEAFQTLLTEESDLYDA